MVTPKHVDGEQSGRILLYTLSTCGWCKKTKALLAELGIAYEYIDVDTITSAEHAEVKTEIAKWNPACSFPTMLVDGEVCIVGFQEEKIRSMVGK